MTIKLFNDLQTRVQGENRNVSVIILNFVFGYLNLISNMLIFIS